MEQNPIDRFREVYSRAKKSGIELPDAAALATVGKDTRPAVRMVLVKTVSEEGFVFYTNLESSKGQEIADNPHVSLCFWWPALQEQVRIEGPVERVSDEEADAYFATRDRDSQIGSWASHQSREMGSPDELLREFEAASRAYANRPVRRPPHWTGFRLCPERMEFWIGKPHRLHDRYLYTRSGDGWLVTMLFP
jgi:pyridoxamine 5'-phosphate oxidase